jgi:hypothetical protein
LFEASVPKRSIDGEMERTFGEVRTNEMLKLSGIGET